MIPLLETERLVLREITERDFEAVHAYASDIEVVAGFDIDGEGGICSAYGVTHGAVLCGSGEDPRGLVPGVGLEPTRYCYHQSLSLARLPISPPRHGGSVTLAKGPDWVNGAGAIERRASRVSCAPLKTACSSQHPYLMRLSDFDYDLPDELIRSRKVDA